MKSRILTFIALIAAILSSCNKEEDDVSDIIALQYDISFIDSVFYRTIIVITLLIKAGCSEITQHGHCWSISPGPTIGNCKTSLGKLVNPVSFSSELTGLTENTSYYIRAYFTINNETLYAEEVSATTLKTGVPRVNTSDISNIRYNTVTTGIPH